MVQKLHTYEPFVNLMQLSLGFIILGIQKSFYRQQLLKFGEFVFLLCTSWDNSQPINSPSPRYIFRVSRAILPEFTTNQSPYQPQLRSHLTGLTITVQSCISQVIPNLQHKDQKQPYITATTHCACTAMCPAPTSRKCPSLKLCLLSQKQLLQLHPKHLSPRSSELIEMGKETCCLHSNCLQFPGFHAQTSSGFLQPKTKVLMTINP